MFDGENCKNSEECSWLENNIVVAAVSPVYELPCRFSANGSYDGCTFSDIGNIIVKRKISISVIQLNKLNTPIWAIYNKVTEANNNAVIDMDSNDLTVRFTGIMRHVILSSGRVKKPKIDPKLAHTTEVAQEQLYPQQAKSFETSQYGSWQPQAIPNIEPTNATPSQLGLTQLMPTHNQVLNTSAPFSDANTIEYYKQEQIIAPDTKLSVTNQHVSPVMRQQQQMYQMNPNIAQHYPQPQPQNSTPSPVNLPEKIVKEEQNMQMKQNSRVRRDSIASQASQSKHNSLSRQSSQVQMLSPVISLNNNPTVDKRQPQLTPQQISRQQMDSQQVTPQQINSLHTVPKQKVTQSNLDVIWSGYLSLEMDDSSANRAYRFVCVIYISNFPPSTVQKDDLMLDLWPTNITISFIVGCSDELVSLAYNELKPPLVVLQPAETATDDNKQIYESIYGLLARKKQVAIARYSPDGPHGLLIFRNKRFPHLLAMVLVKTPIDVLLSYIRSTSTNVSGNMTNQIHQQQLQAQQLQSHQLQAQQLQSQQLQTQQMQAQQLQAQKLQAQNIQAYKLLQAQQLQAQQLQAQKLQAQQLQAQKQHTSQQRAQMQQYLQQKMSKRRG